MVRGRSKDLPPCDCEHCLQSHTNAQIIPESNSIKENRLVWKRASAALEALFEVLSIFINTVKYKRHLKLLRQERNLMIFKIYHWCLEDTMEKNLKNEFLRLLSLGTRKPGEVSTTSLFGPFLNRILKRHCIYMSHGNKNSATFVRSLLESKRCWIISSKRIENSAMEKHKNIMSSPGFTDNEAIEWLIKATDLVVKPNSKLDSTGLVCPTFSACYERSKQDGGCHMESSLGYDLNLDEPYMIPKCSLEQERYCLDQSIRTSNDVIYQAIPEPGKFRIITKGRSNLYTGLRRLQGHLLKEWKKLPFSTMTDYDRERIIFRMTEEGFIDDGSYFISGDYSSATDAMNLDATATVIEELLRILVLMEPY
jgi:hypothetical protein